MHTIYAFEYICFCINLVASPHIRCTGVTCDTEPTANTHTHTRRTQCLFLTLTIRIHCYLFVYIFQTLNINVDWHRSHTMCMNTREPNEWNDQLPWALHHQYMTNSAETRSRHNMKALAFNSICKRKIWKYLWEKKKKIEQSTAAQQ